MDHIALLRPAAEHGITFFHITEAAGPCTNRA
jgi:hypothetical protein